MRKTFCIIYLLFAAFSAVSQTNIVYVTQTGSGSQNGSSWSNALPASSIQTAINSLSPAGGQVWVAAGTYYPVEAFDNDITDPRRRSITLRANVGVYGGFSGNETSISQRYNFGEGQINESILSGDIGVVGDASDNSYHVVHAAFAATNAVIDGFTIRDGNANHPATGSENDGGGIYTRGGVLIENCVIKNNFADDDGGGAFIGENNIIRNSVIHSNNATNDGGGVYSLYFSSSTDPAPLIENCLIYNNHSDYGGGVNLRIGGRVVNCRIIANTARYGGGIHCNYGGEVYNSVVANNRVTIFGGGMYLNYGGITVGNTIVNNHANNSGGGVSRRFGSGVVRNSILWKNNSQFHHNGSGTSIEYSAVQGGYTGLGAGNGIINLSTVNTGSVPANYPDFVSPSNYVGFHVNQINSSLAADWRISCNSACIDTASASLIPPFITTDLDGNNRILDGNANGIAVPDMGAYEYTAVFNVSETICAGDTLVFGNQLLTSSGTYQNNFIASNNCDSIVNLNLSVIAVDTTFIYTNLCYGDTFFYRGQQYTQGGTYYMQITSPGACDSLFQIIVNAIPTDTTILPHQSIYSTQLHSFFGQNIISDGTYYHILQNTVGCDSVIEQSFTVIPVDTVLNALFCKGSIYPFHGQSLNAAGTYFATIQSVSAVDSVIHLNLTELPVDTTHLDILYLSQGSTYNFHGTNITTHGTYYHTATSGFGCDSVLILKVLPRRYVTVNGSGSKNGSSWANAHDGTQLQLTMQSVASAGGGQVWLAKGTYYPTTTTNRSSSFIIFNNMELYGGFNGNETSVSSRAFYGPGQPRETILSGNINNPADSSDNTYTIIKQQMPGYVLIDGFTIRDACNPSFSAEAGGVYLREGGILRNSAIINNYSGWKGGGVYNQGGTIENCQFIGNRAHMYGGGVLLHSGVVKNSSFTGNISAYSGGGLHYQGSSGTVENCTFNGNYIVGYGVGGGIGVISHSQNLTIRNSTFTNNRAVIGGGFYVGQAVNLLIDSCLFDNNQTFDFMSSPGNLTEGSGGAISIRRGRVERSTFINNTSKTGGAVNIGDTAKISESHFIGNSSVNGGGAIYFYQGGIVENSNIRSNSSYRGGGAYMFEGGRIENCIIESNNASNRGAGIYTESGGRVNFSDIRNNYAPQGGGLCLSLGGTVYRCEIYNNGANSGAGIYNDRNPQPVLNSNIYNNKANLRGGGAYNNISNTNTGLYINSNFFNNEAVREGGGLYFYFGGELINCNVVNNRADSAGGGAYINYRAKIKNSVFWGNNTQLQLLGISQFSIDTSAVQGGYSGHGAGNLIINLDSLNNSSATGNYPNFIKPSAFFGNAQTVSDTLNILSSNWNLNCGSALIDVGSNHAVPDTITKDLGGSNRFNDGNNNNSADVDIGAYEANFRYYFDVALCDGDTLMLGTTQITQTGIYTATLTSANSCDSIVTVNVITGVSDTFRITEAVCYNTPYNFNGQFINNEGVYYGVFNSAIGCDSVVELSLQHIMPDSSYLNHQICQGGTFVFNGKTYTQPGVYRDTIMSSMACDSIIIIHLQVINIDTIVLDEGICYGGNYNFFGTNITAAGTYYHNLTSVYNCDSVVQLNLSIHPIDTTVQNVSICELYDYYFYGDTLSQSGTYYHTLTSYFSCDSVIQLNLLLANVDSVFMPEVICNGDSILFYGSFYKAAGLYYHSISNLGGCDSVIILNLTLSGFDTTLTNAAICENSAYVFFGDTLHNAGTYYYTTISSINCDSVVQLNLAVNPIDSTLLNESICFGDSLNFFGSYLMQAGTYYHTLTSSLNCDSIVQLNLTIKQLDTVYTSESICYGDSVNFYGNYLSTGGLYYHALQNQEGCDSTIILNLSIMFPDTTFLPLVHICQGDSFFFGGGYLHTTGYYYHNFTTGALCDSIVVLDLSVVQPPQTPVITYSSDTLYSSSLTGNNWYLDNVLISGAVDNFYVMTTNAYYFVIVSDTLGCRSDTSNILHVYWLGIEGIGLKTSLSVFPNPFKGILNIHTGLDVDFTFEVYSLDGRLLHSGRFAGDAELDLSHLERAAYLIRVSGRGETAAFVVIKR